MLPPRAAARVTAAPEGVLLRNLYQDPPGECVKRQYAGGIAEGILGGQAAPDLQYFKQPWKRRLGP
jgi:hypothetical protein